MSEMHCMDGGNEERNKGGRYPSRGAPSPDSGNEINCLYT